jgi:UPF0755 protein
MTRKTFTILEFIIDLTIVIIASIVFYFSREIQVQKIECIPSGSINQIVSYLHKKDYKVSKIDSIILRFFPPIKKGWIDLGNRKMTRLDFYNSLTNPKILSKNIVLFPGETIYFFLQSVSKIMNLNFDTLMKIYSNQAIRNDGVIIADTYKFIYGVDEKFIIDTLVTNSMKIHKSLANKYLGEYNEHRWFRYITMASVIQKEAGSRDEMPIVSSVIHNRIKKGMKLQMDGALNYGKFSHTRVTKKMIKTDTTKFNTYKYYGLPDSPVASVSKSAIRAAIFPESTHYLYFVMNRSTGKHLFAPTYSEHIFNIKNYGQ